jgi:predicted transcriptional regulator of viral defense system
VKWESLLTLIAGDPIFRSSLLLAGEVSVGQVRLQLSRWVNAGRLVQLRRGVYTLAPAWRKVEPHPFLVANAMQRGSYVSLQSALAYYDLIPEHVPIVTSVGPGRPETLRNALGTYGFAHLARGLYFGYSHIEVSPGQLAFVASPEKALLDLVHLTPGGESQAYLQELRLQNLGTLSIKALQEMAQQSNKPKLIRASRNVVQLLAENEGEIL